MVHQQVALGYLPPPPSRVVMVGSGGAVMVDPTGKTALANFGTAVVNRITDPALIRQAATSGLNIGSAIAKATQARNKALKEAGKSTRAERQADIRQAQAEKQIAAVKSRTKIQEQRLNKVEKRLARREEVKDAKHEKKMARLKA